MKDTIKDMSNRPFCVSCRGNAERVQELEEQMTTAATAKQPTPHGSGADIADLVHIDIEDRAKIGEVKYGERLKPHNGRCALTDAYQEALDLVMYLRQAIQEQQR